MGYQSVENRVDLELQRNRKEQELKELEKKIIELREVPVGKFDGFSEEEMFLINYYGLEQERVAELEFDFSNTILIEELETLEKPEELEIDRFCNLLELLFKIKDFDPKDVNSMNDMFHKDIENWKDFLGDFADEPVIVQKMRNLQLLNRMAHNYQHLFRTILYSKNPQIAKNHTESDRKSIEGHIEELFSEANLNQNDRLVNKFGLQKVNEWKSDKAMKYCMQASRWMFSEKDKYLIDVLQELQNSKEEYNYGVLDDGFVFEVPGYGQFGVHLGKNNDEQVKDFQELYDVGEYQGQYLGSVFILSKADLELLEAVNYEELSDKDKQRYDIARLGVLEPEIDIVKQEEIIDQAPENVGQENDVSQLKEDELVKQDDLIEEIGNKESDGQNEINSEYEQIKEMTTGIVETQQNIEDIKLIISELKAQKSELKQKIKQMNNKINEKILSSDEPTNEVIQDIMELRNTVKQLEEIRKSVKEMIKRYKENKKEMKKELKQEIDERNSAVDEVEI